MEIKAADVKKLRDKTGAGMMDCKKALAEAGGDFAAAEKHLKELGLAAAAKRGGRATNEGRVFARVGTERAGLLELSCETDFVARNTQFIELGNKIAAEIVDNGIAPDDGRFTEWLNDAISTIKENMSLRRCEILTIDGNSLVVDYVHGDGGSVGVLVKVVVSEAALVTNDEVRQFAFDTALHVAAFGPTYLNEKAVPEAYVSEQKDIFMAQARSLGKPDKVLEGIVTGKMKKHFSEICLLEQPFVKDDKRSVAQVAADLGKSLGGTVTVHEYRYMKTGEETE
ncbi:MAG: elongation factor Ts [Spirochaetaceae bacterium]|nr:MAG: elongation factor Ts [Spirochaetaceae bacterium]